MPEGLWPILLFVVVVVVYTIAKVIQYVKQSERQWEQVDRSKLRKWDDDDDWED